VAKKRGSGTTIALLILVVAAIGFIGYYAFIETGIKQPKDKEAPAASPSPAKATSSPLPK
jgi:hypothetical protein